MPTPKGIRVRQTADWFALYLSCTGYANYDNPGQQHFKYTGLNNNSTAGQYIAVYFSNFITNISPVTDLFMLGEPLGSQVATGVRVNQQQGAPPGAMFYLDNGASPLISNQFMSVGGFTNSNSNGTFPQFIIPPGYTLTMCPRLGDDASGCAFWYLPMVDPRCIQPA